MRKDGKVPFSTARYDALMVMRRLYTNRFSHRGEKKMSKNWIRLFLLVCGIVLSAQALANGAIAIDHAKGNRWGVAYDHPNMASAEQRALNECGRGCKVVLRFPRGCGAYSIDRTKGSTVYAWAGDNSRAAAERQAMAGCRNRGGTQCMIRAWGCNSR
jgi:hypothetical protein